MERYFQIGVSNLKHNLWFHVLLAFIVLLISPVFMGIQNLDARSAAKVLEMYVSLLGIILLTPVFLPEQNMEIKELVESKYTKTTIVTLIRILEAMICLVFMIGISILVLRQNQCIFPAKKFFLGTLAEAFFLGSMGLCAYSIFDQIAIAYMLPMVYYIINMGAGKKYVGSFYLFSMSHGSYYEKRYLAATGIVMVIIGVCYPYMAKRIFPKLIRHKINKPVAEEKY